MTNPTLTLKALEIATGYLGIRETTTNRGPEVDAFLFSVGLDPTKGSYPWCYAFVWFCLDQAAKKLNITNPAPRTARVLHAWEKTPHWYKSDIPTPGSVGIIDHGKGRGHAFFVEHATTLHVSTVEGNTNDDGGREGDGVYRHIRRTSEMKGFLDFALPIPSRVA